MWQWIQNRILPQEDDTGSWGETVAASWLQAHAGFRLVTRNWRDPSVGRLISWLSMVRSWCLSRLRPESALRSSRVGSRSINANAVPCWWRATPTCERCRCGVDPPRFDLMWSRFLIPEQACVHGRRPGCVTLPTCRCSAPTIDGSGDGEAVGAHGTRGPVRCPRGRSGLAR